MRARFELFVADVDKTIRFYEATLGFNATRHPGGYVALINGDVEIGTGPMVGLPDGHHFQTGWPASSRPGRGVEIVLEVDEVDAFFLKAKQCVHDCGGEIENLSDQPWGLRDFRLVDPDGYYVRITNGRPR